MVERDAGPEIETEELVRDIERGDPLHVLDIRSPFQLQNGTIDIVRPDRFHNIPYGQILGMEDLTTTGLDTGTPLAVVCSRGNDSRRVAALLNEHGYDARSVHGGMVAWMRMLVAREVEAPPELDAVLQFDRVGKGALTYLLVSSGEALVIDPPRNVQPLLDGAAALEAKIVAVADTHAHADYISGGPGLARSLNVPYFLHAADRVSPYDGREATHAVESLTHGDVIYCGRASLQVEHTPGHTKGSVTFRHGDALAFTGDFVFVRSIGRPDLGGKAEEWTGDLWQSVEQARARWPADLLVCPAHYASEDERREDSTVAGRFADLCARNEPLTITEAGAFRSWVERHGTIPPEVYAQIKEINLGLHHVGDEEADELEMGKNQCAAG